MSKNSPRNIFWDTRAQKYGHTGWADPIIYAYDQRARLAAISRLLESLNINGKEKAFDFGAGAGDFVQLLTNTFRRVIGFDISEKVLEIARKRFAGRAVDLVRKNSVLDLNLDDNSLDLVLSVTVLGHIVDEKELVKTLKYFYDKLRGGGYFFALEFVGTNEMVKGAHHAYIPFKKWVEFFDSSGFSLEKHYGFHHPLTAPSAGFKKYLDDARVKAYRLLRIGNVGLVKKHLTRIADSYAQNKPDFYWNGRDGDKMKIMVFVKK